jgi:hypothetical protein
VGVPADPGPSDTGIGAGTKAGAAAFVAGGVATIVAAIGSFGSDDTALAAARRNHVSMLIAAASAAALGLLLGGLYALRNEGQTAAPGAGLAKAPRGGAILVWLRTNAARVVLAAGVVMVALGVALGAYATANRAPGRPTISIDRVDRESVRVEITADGLPSADWYDALLRGYSDSSKKGIGVFLASARFSPGQDGKVDWTARVQVPADDAGKPITRILVTVARDAPVDTKSCADDQDVVEGDATCLLIRVPSLAETAKTQTAP